MKHHSILVMFCIALGVMGFIVTTDLYGFCLALTPSKTVVINARECNSTDENSVFEKYDNGKSAAERRKRLDAFASFLKENQHFQAYIMSYGGRHTSLGEAKSLGQSAKRYLVKSKGIRPSRIIVVDAGYCENWVVELWYGVKGGSRPVPLPTIDKKQVIMRSGRLLLRRGLGRIVRLV